MQEDIGRHTQKAAGKTIAITFRAAGLSGRVLKWAISAFLNAKYNRGKQDLKHLVRKNAAVEKLKPEKGKELSEETVKILEKHLKKYKVDYTILEDASTKPPTYSLFFKGRDVAVIEQCLKEATDEWDKQKGKGKKSVTEKLKNYKEKSKKMERERKKEKAAEKGEKAMEDAMEK